MYQKTVLDNGIRVVTETIPYVRSASIGFWFDVGSRNESVQGNGVSHFIEHLMFKGTHTRTARDIAEEIDGAGGQLNAFTTKEHTCYYARVLDLHLPLAIEILSDMLLDSVFFPDEMEKEKGVIIEEIKMYEDSPDELIHDLFAETILPDHPMGRGVLGTVSNMEMMTRDDVLHYLRTHYTAGNLVVSVAGNVDHEEVVKTVQHRFARLNGGHTIAAGAQVVPARRTVVRPKDTEQVHLCMGTIGVKRQDPDKYALYLIDTALGGGMSSRLFQELREERGLVYSTYSYHSSFDDTGLFTVYAGTSPGRTDEVLSLVRAELDDLVRRGLTDDEWIRAKEQLKGNLMLSLESMAARMNRLAKSELYYGEFISPDELLSRIDAVTMEDVRRVSNRLFADSQLTVTAIGPLPESGGEGPILEDVV